MFIDPYIHQMNLELLEPKGDNWNFRCPICGDSQKSASKKRGWFKLSKNGVYYYTCFNCGCFVPFVTFLRLYFPDLYSQYRKDNINEITKSKNERVLRIRQHAQEHISKIKEKHNETPINRNDNECNNGVIGPECECDGKTNDLLILRDAFSEFIDGGEFIVNKTKNEIVTLSRMSDADEAYRYISGRKIPKYFFDDLYYVKSYMHFCNCIEPNAFNVNPRFDERIIIPFRGLDGEIIGLQGRSLEPDSEIRYLTYMLDKNHVKIFGLDRVDLNAKDIYLLEGPFDSIMIPNALAIGGAGMDFDKLTEIADKEKFIFLFDPEYKNDELLTQIEHVIYKNFRVCLLPQSIRKYGKDINDFLLNGLKIEELMDIIKKNTFKGTQAKIRINLLRKIYKKKEYNKF